MKTMVLTERDVKLPKRGANFSQGSFSKWESYDKNEIEMILIYTNLLKNVCPLNLG
jgi:hypothetical protein